MVKVKRPVQTQTEYFEAIIDMGFNSQSLLHHLREHGLAKNLSSAPGLLKLHVGRSYASAVFSGEREAGFWVGTVMTKGMSWVVRQLSRADARDWTGAPEHYQLKMKTWGYDD